MISLILVFAVILLSLLIIRVATVVLGLTGMSQESARFQARSAFTGVGFTTSEAESVVEHPVRRRVVMALMLGGSAGVVTTVASLILSFGGASRGQSVQRALILLAGLLLLYLLARNRHLNRFLARIVIRVMHARGHETPDYAGLLQLSGGYTVGELHVEPGDWVTGHTLAELRLRDEGVIVLGIHREHEYVAVPDKETVIDPHDTLVFYAPRHRIDELDERHSGPYGDQEHARASEKGRPRLVIAQ